MEPASTPRTQWLLTQEAFDRLLSALDPDPDRAAEFYLQTRSKLATLFRCDGFPESKELIDATLDRAARRLGEVEVRDLMSFIRGIARNVASEARKKGKNSASLEDIPQPIWDRTLPNDSPAADPEYLRCLDQCTKALPTAEEQLMREYYLFEKRQKIERKRKLAESLGISSGALRVKAFKIRKKLQNCVLACVTK